MRSATPAALFACLLIAAPAASQTPSPASPTTIKQVTFDLVNLATNRARLPEARLPFTGAVADSAGGPILTLLADLVAADATQPAARRQAYKTLLEIMAVRADTQIGSPSDSSGTTSLAMKGLLPAILGFAVEHGAIARDVNGTVATFRFSPAGLVKALQGEGLLDIYRDYSSSTWFNVASRFSAAASFDTSRGDVPNTVLANEQQLSSWSVNVMLWNTRDPRAKRYADLWDRLALEAGVPYIEARTRLRNVLRDWPPFADWQTALADRVTKEVDAPFAQSRDLKAASDRFQTILEEELPKLASLPKPATEVNAAMDSYVSSLKPVVELRNDIYAYALEGSLVTFDWTTTRDLDLPDLYTLTGVWADSFLRSRKDDFTANIALAFYGHNPSGSTRRFKDFVATAQWDRPLGSVLEIPFIISAAARYQYLPDDIPVPASALVASATGDGVESTPPPAVETTNNSAIAPKGHLFVGQAKLTIPLKAGARIPLSVTFANRTELIKENDVRANFGVTFDLDALAAAVKFP